jgi:hypothetical protein
MTQPRALAQLADALRYALHIESMLALAALALAVSLLEWLGTLPLDSAALALPLARAVSAAYIFLALRKAAAGSRRLPQLEDHKDVWDATVFPLMQLAVVGIWYAGATLIVAEWTVGVEVFTARYEWRALELFRQGHLAPLLLLGFFLVYLPPALSAAVVTRKVVGLLDPSLGFRLLHRVAGAYVDAFAGLCVLTLMVFVAEALGAAIERALAIPLAAPVMHNLLTLWMPLAQARLLGNFLHRHRDEICA